MKVLIVPGSTSGNSCQEDGTELAKLHNKALSESLQELERVLEGFRYSYNDFYGSLIERMNNPEAYGTPFQPNSSVSVLDFAFFRYVLSIKKC